MSTATALLRALPAALAAAALAACSDTPAEPRAAAAAPSLAKGSGAPPTTMLTASVRVTDHLGQVVPGAGVVFRVDGVKDHPVMDGGSTDTDPRPGYVRRSIEHGSSYQALLWTVPGPWLILGKETVQPYATPAFGTVNFTDLKAHARPTVRVSLRSMQDPKKAALGAAVRVAARNPWAGLVVDTTLTDGKDPAWNNAWQYVPPADGELTFYAPLDLKATYTVCEVAPPIGFLLANPNCQSFDFDTYTQQSTKVTFLHQTGIVAPPPPAEQ